MTDRRAHHPEARSSSLGRGGGRLGALLRDLRRELLRVVEPVLEPEPSGDPFGRARRILEQLRGHGRRGSAQELSELAGDRRRLSTLLQRVAERGGFSFVLLSDELGLPLAASPGARDPEVQAGVSSLLFTLADRVRQAGGPAPVSVSIRDEAGELTLHRLFSVGPERYLLTAVSKRARVSPEALDSALAALEASLGA